MPTPYGNSVPSVIGKTTHLDVAAIMDPGVTALVDIDLDDNESVTLGKADLLTKTVWLINLDHGASLAYGFVDDDGDAVIVKEVSFLPLDGNAATTKFTATVNTDNAKYMFGISSGDLVFKNTDGDNLHVQISRVN